MDEDDDQLSEVHLFISGHYVITIRREALPALDEQRSKIEGRVMHSEQFLIYRILDALTDSFFPVLSSIDDEIDELDGRRDRSTPPTSSSSASSP